MKEKPLNERVFEFEQRLEKLEKVIEPIEKLTSVVVNLENSIKNGHFCKWNTEIGRLQQFRSDTPTVRKGINDKLKEHDADIEELKLISNELKTGKEILEKIQSTQQTNKKNLKAERTRNRITIALAVGVVLLTFLLNISLELLRPNI